MSRIGRIPIQITQGVSVSLEGSSSVKVVGPKGELSFVLSGVVQVQIKDTKVEVSPAGEFKEADKPMYGLTRAIIANMIEGVSKGFEKKLELSGVGYRAQVSGNDLILSVGFSHPVTIPAPQGIQFAVSENVITVSGVNKVLVGDIASKIRSVRPPEPYKGKGIKYVGEYIRRKAGKVAKAVGTK
ncbi:MAG: 50S ribosomal protein L6 [Candidatus Levybacteria bacterium RIFCSPHIGHO2_02_FULL_42_12]|nr:MAG: 50S ribosomal protein L6 [Candidatus Levybacteria bacterium RIFCSPHIGHO2_01_FULL_42_15]OGH31425.1 MAG: 50S ribosomal protein L6 [Candidatus Levybacteria bacterium RIFCSPHIGHO2_02_FULL_42_12]OGH42689.1 MAG: 50S ribosomal protein L6 [Candidatus Levybacteria bacterium RIFCSPLOWO2_01_FULL_42_15]